MTRRRVFTDTVWEKQVAYCRAIRAGDHIYVTGTAPVAEDGSIVSPNDAYAQAKRCFTIIEQSLSKLGAGMPDVVRTRMFVTDIARWEAFGKAHREAFAAHPPATSMVEVRALIHPDMLIEIEADAVVDEKRTHHQGTKNTKEAQGPFRKVQPQKHRGHRGTKGAVSKKRKRDT